ncbi:unnamed protein product [Calypogeia fissa]
MSSNPENGVPKPESTPALEVSAAADDSIDAGNARVADTVVPMPAGQIGEEIGGLECEELEQSDAGKFDVIKAARRRQGVHANGSPSMADGATWEAAPAPESEPAVDGRRVVVLVVVIGGVTFAEISALHFLGAQEGMKYDFLVAITKLINGSGLLKTLMEDVQGPIVSS